MKTIYTLVLSFFMLTTVSLAQSTAAIEDFSIHSSDFNFDDEAMGIASTFTKTGNTLLWTQSTETNSFVTTYTIHSTEGSWDNTSTTGSITMLLEEAGLTSTLFLTGTAESITLQVVTQGQDNTPETLTFDVDSITYL